MFARFCALAAAVLLAVPAAAQQPVPIPCERACMEDVAGRFLAALPEASRRTLPTLSTPCQLTPPRRPAGTSVAGHCQLRPGPAAAERAEQVDLRA